MNPQVTPCDGVAALGASCLVRRLKKRREFLKVAAHQQKWVEKSLIVQVMRRTGLISPTDNPTDTSRSSPRVGFTVSKKVGGAVVRNRVRRQLRALSDQLMPALARGDSDYVIIGRVAAVDRSFRDLRNDLRAALLGVHTKSKRRCRDPSSNQGTASLKAARQRRNRR